MGQGDGSPVPFCQRDGSLVLQTQDINMKKKIIFILIPVILLIAGILIFVLSSSEGSRSITVISVSGEEAYITKDSDRQFTIREGTRLTAGSTIKTGSTTTIDVLPGAGSPIRINESTEIFISEASGNDLILTVVTGTVSDISSEHTGDGTTIHANNVTMGLRGESLSEPNDNNAMLVITKDDASDSPSWWAGLWQNLFGWITR